MGYIQSENPYMALGQAARGFGGAIGSAMFQVPAIRAEQAYRNRQLGLQEQQLAAQIPIWNEQAEAFRGQNTLTNRQLASMDSDELKTLKLGRDVASLRGMTDPAEIQRVESEALQTFFSLSPAGQKQIAPQIQQMVAGGYIDRDRMLSMAGGSVGDLSAVTPRDAIRTDSQGATVAQGPSILRPQEGLYVGGVETAANSREPSFNVASSQNTLTSTKIKGLADLIKILSETPGIKQSVIDAKVREYNALLQSIPNYDSFQPQTPPQSGMPAWQPTSREQLLRDAEEAIQNGADPEAVRARLQQMGITSR